MQQSFDVDVRNLGSSEFVRRSDESSELAPWHPAWLSFWMSNVGRKADAADIALFRRLLDIPEEAVRACLRGCLEYSGDHGAYNTADHTHKYRTLQESPFNLLSTTMSPPTASTNVSFSSDPSTDFGSAQHAYQSFLSHGHGNDTSGDILDSHSETQQSVKLSKHASRGKEPCNEQNHASFTVDTLDPIWSTSTGTSGTLSNANKRVQDLVVQIISRRAATGCGRIRGHESQHGKHPCTLGCGRRFKTSADAFRHEEIVYPQQFFFCSTCGDPAHPSDKYLFTREDKMRQHLKRSDHANVSLDQCKVMSTRTLWPERCGLCTHHRHPNWKERCRHIIWHCKRGDYDRNNNGAGTSRSEKHVGTAGDDDDDAGDDDDGDEDANGDPPNDPDGAGEEDYGEGPSNKDRHTKDDDHDLPGSGSDEDLFEGWLYDSPDLWQYPRTIQLQPWEIGRDTARHRDRLYALLGLTESQLQPERPASLSEDPPVSVRKRRNADTDAYPNLSDLLRELNRDEYITPGPCTEIPLEVDWAALYKSSGLGDPWLLPIDICLPAESGRNSDVAATSGVTICAHCNAEFSGRYQRGNWARHIRLSHSGTGAKVNTACVCRVCKQEFRRQDARRKHEWKKHGMEDTKPLSGSSVSHNGTPSGQEPWNFLYTVNAQNTVGVQGTQPGWHSESNSTELLKSSHIRHGDLKPVNILNCHSSERTSLYQSHRPALSVPGRHRRPTSCSTYGYAPPEVEHVTLVGSFKCLDDRCQDTATNRLADLRRHYDHLHGRLTSMRPKRNSLRKPVVVIDMRPTHPKIMCPFCPERTEGFRGSHELDRHIARSHAKGTHTRVGGSCDRRCLGSCQHSRHMTSCGAYYNAAAHLRRAHFHPRKTVSGGICKPYSEHCRGTHAHRSRIRSAHGRERRIWGFCIVQVTEDDGSDSLSIIVLKQ